MKRLLAVIVSTAVITGAGFSLAPTVRGLWITSGYAHQAPQPPPRTYTFISTGSGSVQVPDYDIHDPAKMVPGWGSYHDPGVDEATAQDAKIRQLWQAGDFAALDDFADDLRRTKARFASGMWKSEVFYEVLVPERGVMPDAWKVDQQKHEQWITEHPQSVTARIAFAEFLKDYAWNARGNGMAYTVTPEGEALFEQRLARASQVLGDARALETKDPHWWWVAQTVALGVGWDRATYERLFGEAIAFEPEYQLFYTAKANFLLPRWYGEPGEWEKFAAESAARPGGPGPAIYARIVDSLMHYHHNIFNESEASWEQTRTGYEQLLAQFPESGKLRVEFLRLAHIANDRESGKKLFAAIGTRFDPRLWASWSEVPTLQMWAQTTPPARR